MTGDAPFSPMSYDPRMQPRPAPPRELPPTALRLVLGCGILFLLPFLIGGISVTATAFGEVQRHGWRGALGPLIAGGVFVLFPLMFGGIIVYAVRGAMKQAALRGAKPDQPWLWRDDWAAGYAQDTLGGGSLFLFAFAVIWNLIAWMVMLAAWRGTTTPPMLFLLFFPAVGIVIFLAASYQLLRRRKYGKSICRLNAMPIEPGRAFSGEVETHVQEPPEDGFLLQLRCIQRIARGRSTQEHTLWSETTTISRGALVPAEAGMRVPFTLTFPADADAENTEPRATVHWRLKVTSNVPGIDYAAEFELPVFRTPSSS